MKKNIAIFIVGVLIFVASFGGYMFWRQERNDNLISKVSIAPEVERPTYPANNSSNTKQQTTTLKVQGSNDTKQPAADQSSKLPEPTEFEIYEQYATNQTASYVDIQVGQGAEAINGKKVAMLYKGWLTNGELFDGSRNNEQGQLEPFVFQLGGGQVIDGWEQGIAGMKEGGKRRLIIPSSVGYGELGQGPIPPNAMLIFDVDLVAVEP